MKLCVPSFYQDFKCIAGACPDSCCQGWEVDADDASLAYYKTLPDCDMKQRIARVLDKDVYGNTIFRLAEKKRCPFLNEANLCDMHIAIGGEHTPFTCRTFPRFINDFGSLREMGISFSCPVASDMMFAENCTFDFTEEINDLPPMLNDIDAELYFLLLRSRKTAYEIVQNRTVPVADRLIQLLDFAEELQEEIGELPAESEDIAYFDIFRNPELINPQWLEKVNAAADCAVPNTIWAENVAMYFLFRYFLNAVYDRDVLSVAKMTVAGVLIPTYFGQDSWTMHLWSKETEHSDVNMERYRRLLRTAKALSVMELKNRLTAAGA